MPPKQCPTNMIGLCRHSCVQVAYQWSCSVARITHRTKLNKPTQELLCHKRQSLLDGLGAKPLGLISKPKDSGVWDNFRQHMLVFKPVYIAFDPGSIRVSPNAVDCDDTDHPSSQVTEEVSREKNILDKRMPTGDRRPIVQDSYSEVV
ncbi:MAG: hypothetical protein L6R42_003032 [Xanthoria sp. 1 TBL-2021]|nr:MAG: hypothetical protein L6R42_003032 [Xanthoria sp. 1 TBL-2021]